MVGGKRSECFGIVKTAMKNCKIGCLNFNSASKDPKCGQCVEAALFKTHTIDPSVPDIYTCCSCLDPAFAAIGSRAAKSTECSNLRARPRGTTGGMTTTTTASLTTIISTMMILLPQPQNPKKAATCQYKHLSLTQAATCDHSLSLSLSLSLCRPFPFTSIRFLYSSCLLSATK